MEKIIEVNSKNLKEVSNSSKLKDPIDSSVTVPFMNVGSAIDPEMQSPLARYMQKECEARVFSLLTGPQCAQPLLEEAIPQAFLEYQEKIRGYPIQPLFANVTTAGEHFLLSRQPNLQQKTLRAYMATPSLLHIAHNSGMRIADWNEHNIHLVMQLNNKLTLHDLLRDNTIEEPLINEKFLNRNEHLVPLAIEVNCNELAQVVCSRIETYQKLYQDLEQTIQAIYKQHGIRYQPYSPGVMVRPTWGCGGHDAFSVRYTTDKSYLLQTRNRQYQGKSMEDIYTLIKQRIVEKSYTSKFIITRFLDICESPGMNIINGLDWYYIAPVHGQIFNGTTAVGSCSYVEDVTTTNLLYFNGRNSSRSDLLFKAHGIAASIANFICVHGGKGLSGLDFMFTGFFEHAFAKAVQHSEFQEEAIGAICIAELNMRPTQSALQRYTILAIQKMLERTAQEPITYKELLNLNEQVGKAIHYTSSNNFFLDPSSLETIYTQKTLLAGINGKAEGIYIASPANSLGQVAIGIIANNKKSLRWYELELMALNHKKNLI